MKEGVQHKQEVPARLAENSHAARHARELQCLYQIAEVLTTRSGQEQMLSEVLGLLEEELGMSRGTVMLLSADGEELVIEAVRNPSSGHREEMRYQRGEGITGKVLQTGRPYIVPRISQEPQFRDRIHRRQETAPHEASFICLPIAVGNEVVGTLSIDLPYDEAASLEEDQRVLSIVAAMIANDVKNRRLAIMQKSRLEAENLRLRTSLGEKFRPENIIGNAGAMRDVYTQIHQVAGSEATVLIQGESGTGKELVASAIHYGSARAQKPFVKVNCAALNENLLESELFGHERGAFTGALYRRIGRIEEAEGGTLFLDEIGEISPAIQAKLLRVLQEREFARVGSNQTLRADVRIIAATNRDLGAGVEAGTFRQDLYYRINVFQIRLPPLRDRRNDILLLADHFVQKYAATMGKEVRRISTSAINMLLAYHWPGNVRELENCIQHAVLVSEDSAIHGHNLPPTLQTPAANEASVTGTLRTSVMIMERDMIIDALKRTKGNVSAAARELGITPRMVRYKIKKFKIDDQRFFRRNR